MNREYPEVPIVAVGVVVKRGHEVLLVQRLNEPSQGRWSLPGGVVELGETVREAARREVQEECGLQIEPGEVLAVVDNIVRDDTGRIRFHYVLIDLLAEYVGGEPTAASDIGDARWVRAGEVEEFDVTERAGQLVREVLKSAPRPLGDEVAQLRSSAR